jgi:hypothetical protein
MIKYTSPAPDYARRPRAPRRRKHVPAQPGPAAGQLTLTGFENRQELVDAARTRYRCPDCHAPKNQPCTRKPTLGENGRQPMWLMVHPPRLALLDAGAPEDDDTARGRTA